MKVKELIAKLCNHNNMDDEVFLDTDGEGLVYVGDVEYDDDKVIICQGDVILDEEDMEEDKYKRIIEDVLDCFDFQRVWDFYNAGFVNWMDKEGRCYIPKVDELKDHARMLINRLVDSAIMTGVDDQVEMSAGDFTAKVYGAGTEYFEVNLYFIPEAARRSSNAFDF